ncbi:TetR/AcrR family transcriptional regulator [Vibrio sp. Isolate30]|uniref:TetR/AcrR family transcriptional regulator n=1 Tax=Vibrio sp. Isolate30 TaxID=2908536 RepID=UPI001EFCF68E|nr:TetR/AcrR family transcriptional regulator [Vibrio sp. Isolate30]MCG9629496.1 TetR/AcrR family transcriptional regulator [Vibrio sp. Isolate30]
MARITAEQKAQKKQAMDKKILSIFLEEGWGAVTYDRLAKEFNTRKSSIQAYYSSNIMFATALQGKVLPMVVPLLNFHSKESFVQSWLSAYDDPENHIFQELVNMLLENIIKDGSSPYSRGAIVNIHHLLEQNMTKEEAETAIKSVFGEMMYKKIFN